MSRRALSAGLMALVTLGMLALAARNVDPKQLWALLLEARWRWLPVMGAISALDVAIRARRWQLLLSRSGAKPGFMELFKLEAIGLAVNNVLFMRLGELARAWLGARELSLPVATVLASVAVERALDVAALLSLFAVAAAGAPDLVNPRVRQLGLLALCGALAALIALAAAEAPLSPGGAWETRLRRWPRLHDLIVQLAAGAAVLRSAPAAAQAAALSLALWGVDALVYWAGARALGLGGALDYGRSVLVLATAGAGSALPAAPGSFGTFEAAVTRILASFGVEANAAFGYAVFVHMVMYLFITILGLAFLYTIGLSLGELHAALQKKEDVR